MKSVKAKSSPSKKSQLATAGEHIVIYCDGACSGNQFSNNVGGWGAVLQYKKSVKEIYGGERNTTNQRMELTSCINALQLIKRDDLSVQIFSDSAYLVNCFHQGWYKQWMRNHWKNAKKKPVENRDLWERLIALVEQYNVTFHKVEGHSGVDLNERADELARKGIETAL